MFYTKEQEDVNESRLEYLLQCVHPGPSALSSP